MTTVATPVATADPLDTAMEEQKQTKHYFGEVAIVDAVWYTLRKGQGKKLFDASIDPVKDRRTQIAIEVQPLVGQYTIKRECFDFTDDWQKHTLPSIKKLGIVLRDLRGKFVHLTLEQSGTYTNAAGELKDRTAIVFQAVYPDRQACEDAAAAFFGRDDDEPSVPTPTPAPHAAVELPPLDEANAKSFIELIWKMSAGNVSVFESQLAANPMLAGYTTLHPLVEQVTGIDPLPF
jgi:hypothetical protein